jgi:hypothetical protein
MPLITRRAVTSSLALTGCSVNYRQAAPPSSCPSPLAVALGYALPDVTTVDYLVVAGGGSAGSTQGGAGGAGGFRTGTGLSVTAGSFLYSYHWRWRCSATNA